MSATRPAAPNPGNRDDAGEAETRLALPQPPRNVAPSAPPPWPAASLIPPPPPLPPPPPNATPPYGQYGPYGQPPAPFAPPYGQPPPSPQYGQQPLYGQQLPYGQQPIPQPPLYQPPPYGYPTPPAPPPPPAPAFDLTRAIEGMRLGDLLAVSGSTLFVFAKFLPFAALQSGRAGFPYVFVYSGWEATNGLWNLLQLLLWFAAVDVALGGLTERFAPVPVPKGVRYLLIGGLLGVTTLFGLVGLNSVRVGLFALLLSAGAVAAGGLLKVGIIPGDDRVVVANLNTRRQQPYGYRPPYGSAPPPGSYPPQPPPQPYGAPPPPPNPYGQPPPPPHYGNYGTYGNAPPYNSPPPPPRR